MFESAEIGHKVSKAQFKKQVPVLRESLLEAQAALFAQKKFPVVVLISGEDGAGKRETISVLYEWMDPRYLSTLAFEAPTDEERERASRHEQDADARISARSAQATGEKSDRQ